MPSLDLKKTFCLWAALAAPCFLFAAPDAAYVKRGTPQREGRAWVERAECGSPASPGGKLLLRADLGSITVQPGANDRMTCQITLRAYPSADGEAALRLLHSYELGLQTLPAGGISLAGRFSNRESRHRSLSVAYEIRVPRQFNLDVKTQGGEVAVSRLDGELRAVTAGGDIHAGDVTGRVTAETAGGDIDLGNIGSRLEARTAGGGIRVGDVQGDAALETSGGEIRAGRIRGNVSARTAGGDILLRGASGPVRAQTAGGQIRIGPCEASIQAQTAGGSIHLQGARGLVDAETAGGNIDLFRLESAVRAQTAAGRILAEISASRGTFGPSELATSVGDVQVFLPPDLPLTIRAAIEQAFGHQIVSDFPLHIQGREESFRRRSQRGEAAVNGGGSVLRIRTVTGSIEIRKLDPQTLEQLKARQAEFWKHWQEYQEHQSKDPGSED